MIRSAAVALAVAFGFIASTPASASIGAAAQKRIATYNTQIAALQKQIDAKKAAIALDQQRIANAQSIDAKLKAAEALPQSNGQQADAKCKALDAVGAELASFKIKTPVDGHGAAFKKRIDAAKAGIQKQSTLTCKQLDFLIDDEPVAAPTPVPAQ